MPAKGSFLKTGEYLGTNDYLVADNQLFFAIQQGDGNLCVYRGSGPGDNHGLLWDTHATAGGGKFFAVLQADGNFCTYRGSGPGSQGSWLWGSQATAPGGVFFAALQGDGNLCVYKGKDPGDNKGYVWGTQAIDPVADFEIATLDYDVNGAKVLQSGPAELYRQTVRNDSQYPQSSTITGSQSVSETSGWSDSLAVKVGVSTSFKTGIPFVAEGKVQVSVEVTNTYTWNGSKTSTKTWGFNTPVSVPAKTVIIGLVSATLSTIAVPYTMKGSFILRSGVRIPGTIQGTYLGTNSHDLTVTFAQRDAKGALVTQVQAIEQLAA
jgi:hypothetical protein